MTDDVRLSTGLPQHPKTKKLHRRLGGDGCWALVRLFLWAGEHRWEGDLAGLSDEDIELAVDWAGEPGAMVAALIEVRFLIGNPGKRKIHDWQDHNPYAASKGQRIAKGKIAAAARWERARQSAEDAPSKKPNARSKKTDARSMPGACPEHAASTGEQCPPAPAPAPSPADPPDTSPEGTRDERAAPAYFEGHAEPGMATPNPAAALAIALNRFGVRCTSLNPDLIAYSQAGGTAQHLLEVAKHDDCKGKPAAYVIRFAMRELKESPKEVSHGTPVRKSAAERVQARIAERGPAGNVIEGSARRVG